MRPWTLVPLVALILVTGCSGKKVKRVLEIGALGGGNTISHQIAQPTYGFGAFFTGGTDFGPVGLSTTVNLFVNPSISPSNFPINTPGTGYYLWLPLHLRVPFNKVYLKMGPAIAAINIPGEQFDFNNIGIDVRVDYVTNTTNWFYAGFGLGAAYLFTSTTAQILTANVFIGFRYDPLATLVVGIFLFPLTQTKR